MNRKMIIIIILIIITISNIILFKNYYNTKLKNDKNEIKIEASDIRTNIDLIKNDVSIPEIKSIEIIVITKIVPVPK